MENYSTSESPINEEEANTQGFNYGKKLGYSYLDAVAGPGRPSLDKYVEHNQNGDWTKRLVVTKGDVQSIEKHELVNKLLINWKMNAFGALFGFLCTGFI